MVVWAKADAAVKTKAANASVTLNLHEFLIVLFPFALANCCPRKRRGVTGELKTAGDRGQRVGWWFG
jgi:hypothetical protein